VRYSSAFLAWILAFALASSSSAQETLRIDPPRSHAIDLEPLPEPIETPARVDLSRPIVSTPDARLPQPIPIESSRNSDLPLISPPVPSEIALPIVDELGPLPGDTAESRRTQTRRRVTTSRKEDIEPRFEPPSRRQGPLARMFARIGGRPVNQPSRIPHEDVVVSNDDRKMNEGEAVRAADAKRRIEREVMANVGDRIRSMDVRVAGKRAYVNVESTRFYFKRGVRRTIEGLPSLRGFENEVVVE
jgi:hypothetical protein